MLTVIGRSKILNALLSGRHDFKVLDPACGTGGFLVYLMQECLRQANVKHSSREIDAGTLAHVTARLRQATFFGSDANEGVAAAAKMNMIIAGDGHSNIRAEDSLSISALNWSTISPDCDMIMTNPPFGTSEADSLSQSDYTQYPIRATKGQHLFLEKMVLSTRPGGEICTVIDDGVLNTDSGSELRRWLFQKCKVIAVIRLPDDTFKPNKITVKSSVLYLRRREQDDVDLEDDYPVTFCVLDSLGYVGSGEPIRGYDFRRTLREIGENLFAHTLAEERSGYRWHAFDVRAQEIVSQAPCRLDEKYWNVGIRTQLRELLDAGARSLRDLNLISTGRGKSPPASAYVDREDGYALVVKAGSNISKYGQLAVRGDFIEKNVYDELESAHLRNGDVLLASTGDGTLGKSCVFRETLPAVADGHVTIIRVDPAVVYPEYLADYLRTGFGAEQVARLYTGSTGLIELTPNHVDSIVVDLLSGVEEQERISRQLREREKQYRDAIGHAEQTLQQAVSTFREETASVVAVRASTEHNHRG